jgi:DNA replication ATP-dependent helicase Dna2
MTKQPLLSPIDAAHGYANLADSLSYFEETPRQALQKIGDVFFQTINLLTTQKEKQVFVGWFAKINFLTQAYGLPEALAEQLQALRRLLNKQQSRLQYRPTPEELQAALAVATRLISTFGDAPPPDLEKICQEAPLHLMRFEPKQEKRLRQVYAVFLEVLRESQGSLKQNTVHILCNTEAYGKIEIAISDTRYSEQYTHYLSRNIRYLRPYQPFYITHIEALDEQHWLSTRDSLLIASPDYLIDVSSVAKCVSMKGASPYLYLLGKLKSFSGNAATVAGNLANEMLDLLVAQPQLSFDAALRLAFESQALDCALLSNEELRGIKQSLAEQFTTLQACLAPIREAHITTEPSFVSSLYGLQGRLDVLIEYPPQEGIGQRKDIYELKSSGNPANVGRIAYEDQLVQVACYNLMIDSTFPERSGVSAILYSKDKLHPLRDCGRLDFQKHRAMMLRNRIVSLDYELASGNTKVFDYLLSELRKAEVPAFSLKDAEWFQAHWQQAQPRSKAYFMAFVGLVAREMISAKVGGTTRQEGNYYGFAGLWKSNIEQKNANFSILHHLEFLSLEAESQKITFRRKDRQVVAFRQGDIVLLYPHSTEEASPLRQQLIKGHISEVNAEYLVLRLRNKFIDEAYFKAHPHWAVESDFNEQGFQYHFTSLAEFLAAPEAKQNLLLGLEAPRFQEDFHYRIDSLSEEQNDILQLALSAQDYFLLQGPPGTGKTSKMLKNMVQYLFEQTEEYIVLLAFTNRATDEICEKVAQITPDFIRLGYVGDAHEFVAQSLSRESHIPSIRERLAHTRIFVSTVTSFYRYRHLVKRCDTLIVDEASQLLEPHLCGILPAFRRFILIGDEKQLPAIVAQPKELCQHEDEALQALHIQDLSVSLFERLLHNAQQKGWHKAYKMLETQYRSHQDIAGFISEKFYKTLRPGSPRQQAAFDLYQGDSPVEQLLAQGRLLFIPSSPGKQHKFHLEEAQRVRLLAEAIRTTFKRKGDFTAGHLGVITPYRAQIAEIYKLFDEELRTLVTVDTVERFQGSEREVIILSMALSQAAQMPHIQALDMQGQVDRKLNVALSRAREQLIVLGDARILQEGKFYKMFLEWEKVLHVPFVE